MVERRKVEGHPEVCHCHVCQDPCKTVTEPMPFSTEEAARRREHWEKTRQPAIVRDVKREAD